LPGAPRVPAVRAGDASVARGVGRDDRGRATAPRAPAERARQGRQGTQNPFRSTLIIARAFPAAARRTQPREGKDGKSLPGPDVLGFPGPREPQGRDAEGLWGAAAGGPLLRRGRRRDGWGAVAAGGRGTRRSGGGAIRGRWRWFGGHCRRPAGVSGPVRLSGAWPGTLSGGGPGAERRAAGGRFSGVTRLIYGSKSRRYRRLPSTSR